MVLLFYMLPHVTWSSGDRNTGFTLPVLFYMLPHVTWNSGDILTGFTLPVTGYIGNISPTFLHEKNMFKTLQEPKIFASFIILAAYCRYWMHNTLNLGEMFCRCYLNMKLYESDFFAWFETVFELFCSKHRLQLISLSAVSITCMLSHVGWTELFLFLLLILLVGFSGVVSLHGVTSRKHDPARTKIEEYI